MLSTRIVARPKRITTTPPILEISTLLPVKNSRSNPNPPPNNTTKITEKPSTNDAACRKMVKRRASLGEAGTADRTCCDMPCLSLLVAGLAFLHHLLQRVDVAHQVALAAANAEHIHEPQQPK